MSVKIGIINAGSWGTTLAKLLAEKYEDTTIWAREDEVCNSINNGHENKLFLPEISLPQNLKASTNIQEVAIDKDVLLIVTPSQYLRETISEISYLLNPGTHIVLASKGIENGTLKLMNQVLEELLPDNIHKNIFIISGPTFARELAQHSISAAVVASHNTEGMEFIQNLFHTDYFRIYRSADVIGVELGGALKNIIAIAVGILEGIGLGKNSQAALMTRAIAEITRLVTKMGGNPFTVTGLSGMGDLILTCTGNLSRNRQVGIRLGKGEKIKEIINSMKMVAEGVATSNSAYDLARKLEVEMPIVETVYKILYEDLDIKEGLKKLMSRSLKDEIYGYGV